MTENLAGRGEGLKERIAELWREASIGEHIHTTETERMDYCRICWSRGAARNSIMDLMPEILAALEAAAPPSTPATGETSDGYHTFNELYEHRHALFSVLCATFQGWKSMLHEDGTMFDGWFIAGVMTPKGQATYHLPMNWWGRFNCAIAPRAPHWDGHTAADVPTRIAALATPAPQPKSCDASHVETEGDAAWQASNKSSPSVQDKALKLARILNDARIGDGQFIDIGRATPLLAAALATPSPQASVASTSITTPRKITWFCRICERDHTAYCPAVSEDNFLHLCDHCGQSFQGNQHECPVPAATQEPAGALREALADLIKMHDERRLVSVAEANLRVDKAREALSLSSPIEPPPEVKLFDLVEETRRKLQPYLKIETFPTGSKPLTYLAVDTILQAALEAYGRPPQASSEVRELREALEEIRRTPKMPFPDAGAHSWRAYADALSRAYNRIQTIATDALAPSRQGAGGK